VSQNDTEEMMKELLLLKMFFGKAVEEGLERVKEFTDKHEQKGNLDREFNIGLMGPFLMVIPKSAQNPRLDTVLAVDLRMNKVFIDEYGEYGPAITSRELYAKTKAENPDFDKEESNEKRVDEVVKRVKALENELFASLEKDDKKIH